MTTQNTVQKGGRTVYPRKLVYYPTPTLRSSPWCKTSKTTQALCTSTPTPKASRANPTGQDSAVPSGADGVAMSFAATSFATPFFIQAQQLQTTNKLKMNGVSCGDGNVRLSESRRNRWRLQKLSIRASESFRCKASFPGPRWSISSCILWERPLLVPQDPDVVLDLP